MSRLLDWVGHGLHCQRTRSGNGLRSSADIGVVFGLYYNMLAPETAKL